MDGVEVCYALKESENKIKWREMRSVSPQRSPKRGDPHITLTLLCVNMKLTDGADVDAGFAVLWFWPNQATILDAFEG